MLSNPHTHRASACRPGPALWPAPRTARISLAALLLALGGLLGTPAAGPAQQPEDDLQVALPLLEQKPFDRIVLDKANKNEVLKVLPLDLPNRQVPADPGAGSRLRFRLVEQPDKEYEVPWRSIDKVELFEQIILQEAEQLVEQGQLDEAYDYYAFLLDTYPQTQGLERSLQTYLYIDAGQAFRKKRYPEALGVLEELHRLNPQYRHSAGAPPLMQVLGSTAEKLVSGYIGRGDYYSARTLLDRLDRDYGERKLAMIAQNRQRLVEAAQQKLEEAREHLAAERYREARRASGQMVDIWPDLEGARQLAAEMAEQHPLVVVGTAQPALRHDPQSLDDWAARRTGRLVHRTLMEFHGAGPEGGQYQCPWGSVERSDNRQQLVFRLQPGDHSAHPLPLTGYDVSRHLLALADPSHPACRPAWAGLLAGVSVQDVMQVSVDLRFPHMLPQALLQTVLDGAASGSPGSNPGFGPFVADKRSETELSFLVNDRYPLGAAPRVQEIIERFYEDPQQAITALRRGEIDVIDRLFPADAVRLQNDESVVVQRYALPTVHMLVPGRQTPFTSQRTFRRALVYAINRAGILEQELLGGERLAGYRVISGPFPAGVRDQDPLAYAYDDRIRPRSYDPLLAKTLVHLAFHEIVETAKKRDEEPPEWPELVLGHPAHELARVACQAIAQQFQLIGVPCTLKELPPGQVTDPEGQCDLVYLELAMWEPAVDAARLLGPDGVSPTASSYVALALRQLEDATSWRELREALHELHRIAYNEVAAIPLWQTADSFAYRRGLRGLGNRPVSLYQHIEQWNVLPQP